MKKIASFTIDHERLKRGLYVSRIDYIGTEKVTTFDIRMKEPNREKVMGTAEMHTIEHLAATYLRNISEVAPLTVYFGPMGCRTGFYLLLAGEHTSKEILPVIQNLFAFVAEYEGEIPGADPVSCGNFSDMDLPLAKEEAKRFLEDVLLVADETNLTYPQ